MRRLNSYENHSSSCATLHQTEGNEVNEAWFFSRVSRILVSFATFCKIPRNFQTEGNEVSEGFLEGGALRRRTGSQLQCYGLARLRTATAWLAGDHPSIRSTLRFLRYLLFRWDLLLCCLRKQLCANSRQRCRTRSAQASNWHIAGRSRPGAGAGCDESKRLRCRP